MEKRMLGTSAIAVQPLCLGSNVFGWTIDEKTSFEILDHFTESGFNFIDTADTYSSWVSGNKGGESETIIGAWMKKKRNRKEVIIATKVGSEMNGQKGLSREYIIQEVEESLKRLGTDYIDLYQSHYPDPSTPVEETLEAYQQLIRQGKVRAIGASNYTAEQLTEAIAKSRQHNLPSYQTLQPLYNLYDRKDFETNLQPICAKNKIGVLPYYSLASGFLTGKYRSEADLAKSPRGGGAKKYLNNRGYSILKALDAVANHYAASPSSIAIAWLLTRSTITASIASATTIKQVADLIKATEIQLDENAIALLDRASND